MNAAVCVANLLAICSIIILRAQMSYESLVYTTREPPEMAQFDWFAISGYCRNVPRLRTQTRDIANKKTA